MTAFLFPLHTWRVIGEVAIVVWGAAVVGGVAIFACLATKVWRR